MLKIGTVGWGECPKCIYFNKQSGCSIIKEIRRSKGDEDVYCIDGINMADEFGQVGEVEFEVWE